MRYLYTLLFLLLPISVAHAQATADEAYAAADYPTAITLYQQQLASTPTATLYYNLGCAYFKHNDIAQALLHFERAYLLAPSDSDIAYNIQFANRKTIDKMETVPPFFLSRWSNSLSHWLSLRGWMWVGFICFAISIAAALFFWISDSRHRKKVAFYSSLAALVLTFVANGMVYESYQFSQDRSWAILTSEIVTVKSAPDKSSEEIVVVHAGLKVRILQTLNGFAEVRLPDTTVGWLPLSDLEVINIFH